MTRTLRTTLAVVVVLTTLALGAPARAADRYPTFTGVEFKELYYARMATLPGVARITSRPPIYGHAGADERIQRLAEGRGYRLQATPTVALGSYGGLTLAADAGRAWQALLAAARANGTPLQGNSGYRSVDTQRGIFIRQLRSAGYARIGRAYTTAEIASGVADGAIDSVLAYHSVPGYSRHHTGKTIDLSHAGGSNGSFAGSAAYRWISAGNYAVAKQFGLIPNYPPDAGAQGPNPEPWEFSFVGNQAIRCAIRYVVLRDPEAAAICGGGVDDLAFIEDRNGTLIWHLRTPGQPETTIAYGSATNTPATGDWNGDNRTDLAFIEDRNGTLIWHLRTPGQPETTIAYGSATNTPATGDWNGDNRTDLAFIEDRNGTLIWHLRTPGQPETTIAYGSATNTPATGDWNGDNRTDLAFIEDRNGTLIWHLRTPGQPETTIAYGSATNTPATGDWNGDNRTDLAFIENRNGTLIWHLRTPGQPETTIAYGSATNTPATGDWNGR